MDAKHGVALRNGNAVVEKTPDLGKENEIVESRVEPLQVNGFSKDLLKRKGLKTYRVKDKHTVIVTESRSSNALKISGAQGGNHSKRDKMPKDQASQRGLTMMVSHKQNLGLSQSLTSPSKGILTSGNLRKSNAEQRKKKTHVKDYHVKGTVAMPLVPNGHLNSTFRPSNSNSRASAGVGSIGASDGGISSKRNILASSKSNIRGSKSVQGNAIANSASSKARPSTASHGLVQHRSTGSGFPSRVNERAEKRNSLSKLEEKTHEKEVEKTNLQEKSKKSKDAEMKQWRKSSAVKAPPTPSSYKEPCPTKVELKKVSNLQEKSKKSKDAEMKQWRKSPAVKAPPTPSSYKEPCPSKVELKKKSKETEMKQWRKSSAVKAPPTPSSYKEPCPLKVELKKQVQTTRPKPPNAGRPKSSVTLTDCSNTRGGSSRRSSNSSLGGSKTYVRRPQIGGHGDSTSSNKPVLTSLSKLPSQKASVVVKLKVTDSCPKTLPKCKGGTEQKNLSKSVEDSPPRVEAQLELFSILDDDDDDDGVIINLPDPP